MVSDDRRPRGVYGVGEEPDPRFSLANERTSLAWMRTGLGLVGGGVASSPFPASLGFLGGHPSSGPPRASAAAQSPSARYGAGRMSNEPSG